MVDSAIGVEGKESEARLNCALECKSTDGRIRDAMTVVSICKSTLKTSEMNGKHYLKMIKSIPLPPETRKPHILERNK